MKSGPVPKPRALRQNRNKRPEIGIVPARQGLAIVPRPPNGLLDRTRRVWRGYWQSAVSATIDQQADMHRLERWIWAVDEYNRCAPIFRKTRLLKGSEGQPRLNPLASYIAQIERELREAENEMGLTPSARLRLGIEYGEAQLTALELNRQLDELSRRDRAAVEREAEAWEAEWETA